MLKAANAIFFAHLIVRLGSLILVPLCLKYWSAVLYGEYLALFAAVNYLTSLDFGMQQAAVNRLTQAYAKGEFAEYRVVQHTAMAFYLVLAATCTVLVALAAWLLPLPRWIGLKVTNPSVASLAIVLIAIYAMWSMPMRLITAAYQTAGNLARSQWVANGQQILLVLLTALALVLGGKLLAVASVQILTVAATAAFVLIQLHNGFSRLFPGVTAARLPVLKELMHPSLLFGLLLVANLIAYQGTILLTSAALGGLAVVTLSVSRAIVDVVRQALYAISLALSPDFARLEARQEFARLRQVHRLMMAATAAATLAAVGALWFEGPQLIIFWTRGRVDPDPVLFRLFLTLLALQTPWAASSTIATSTNRHQVQAIGYFLAAMGGTLVAAVFIHRLGTWAVPLGLILGEALGCYHFVIRATCHIIQEPYGAFALRFWGGFILVGGAVLVTGWGVHRLVTGPLLARCALTGLSTIAVATVCAWFVWLRSQDRELLLPKIRLRLYFSEVSNPS